ncbi:unnamed protein product [Sphagnum troendelagicum]|uniref:MADS-box domain-containing protein n=1 Tax=Sphagnum troendelagicum TaxID=128251 RepID=A0ABP0TJ09_9BRYO
MGKVKIETKKLEEENNRRSTFAKRGNGVLKKACELSILCDTDVTIIAFSPTGELLYYCNTSVADVIKRFADVDPKRRTEILERQILRLEAQCNISLKDQYANCYRPENDEVKDHHPNYANHDQEEQVNLLHVLQTDSSSNLCNNRPENDEVLDVKSLPLNATIDEDMFNPPAPKRARASGGVRFVSQPNIQQEPHQFHPQGTIGVVGMAPSTCATAVRFLPQIDVQQVAPLQAVPPIDTASGITPGENFQDGIYMRNKGTTSQSHHARFRRTVQAAYDKACHLNQIEHAHQGADYKKAIREDQGFGASLWSAFPGCSNGNNFTQGTFECDDGQNPLL